MAIMKHGHQDRRHLPFSPIVAAAIFVSFCLIGVWMLMPLSMVPAQRVEILESKVGLRLKDGNSEEGSTESDKTSFNEKLKENDRVDMEANDNADDLRSDESDRGNFNEDAKENENKDEESKAENKDDENMVTGETLKEDTVSQDENMPSEESSKSLERNESTLSSAENHDEVDNSETKDFTTQEQVTSSQDKDATKLENQAITEENHDEVDNSETKDLTSQEQVTSSQHKDVTKLENQAITDGNREENQAIADGNREDLQADKSVKEKDKNDHGNNYKWTLCNTSAGQDYIPCLDNVAAIKQLHSTAHYEHRERHCPEEPPTCLVPLPNGYKKPITWPKSRDVIWYDNVPHVSLADIKKRQNWIKVTGKYISFPGGGTQFKKGASRYIQFIEEMVPEIAWGKHTRVMLDVGCGVASLGGYMFDKDVLTMSLAPKDEHEAQVQLALERGVPAISAVMGTQRLPFPSFVFDVVHCARCRVPWHSDGGRLLLELDRLLRPGGYFVWSATPVYQKLKEDVEIWKAMSALTSAMCWKLISRQRDRVNAVGIAVFQKPTTNTLYELRSKQEPPLCEESDDPNAAWYVPMKSCMHKIPSGDNERATQWPEKWPSRLQNPPFWLSNLQAGLYGKQAAIDFTSDLEHWQRVVTKSYLAGMGIDWSSIRNVMDMKAVYGGFAASLAEKPVWVMNVVPIEAPDTLSIIYDRGLFGVYHDWCEPFSTYPRTYDLLHADHLFSKLKNRCNLLAVMAEVDRITRPKGWLILRDKLETINELEVMLKSLNWEIRFTFSKEDEGILSAQKTMWRPV